MQNYFHVKIDLGEEIHEAILSKSRLDTLKMKGSIGTVQIVDIHGVERGIIIDNIQNLEVKPLKKYKQKLADDGELFTK